MTERNDEVYRFSSCRGVSFEIQPHVNNLFAVNPPPPVTNNIGGSSQRSWVSCSSHFCDLDLEDSGIYDDVEAQEAAPKTSQPPANKKLQPTRLSIILFDQGLFTVYKRLFVVSLFLNLLGLVLAATGKFHYARNRAAVFSIANILVVVLCRSELFLRALFWLAVTLLGHSWIPLRIKTMATSFLQSLGGIHSGCGISSINWLVYALILTLKEESETTTSTWIVGVASGILGLLFLSSVAAFPLVRHLHHNIFERTHRFAGWASLALLWIFVLLSSSYEPSTPGSYYSTNHDLSMRLVRREEFWLTMTITILIVVPWLTIRRVPVRVSSPSGHASIIKFDGGIKAGILGRISRSPLSEWHAFGIISDNKNEHMMLAGAVGDFTKSLVSDPPKHLWVRQVRFAGLPYLTNMYDRVLLVATGSGICVFLSFLLQPCRANVSFIWVAKGVEENFGKEIKEWMSGHSVDKVMVHDTAVLGRPNVSELTVDRAKKIRAEVVIVTSNPEGSRDVVRACQAQGIAAFGPIWDS